MGDAHQQYGGSQKMGNQKMDDLYGKIIFKWMIWRYPILGNLHMGYVGKHYDGMI